MQPRKILARIAILLFLGVILQTTGGCGDGSVPLDPEGGEKLKQARINAYGKSGVSTPKGGGASASGGGAQASARQKAGGGR